MEFNWPTIWAAIGSLATCVAAGATAWAAYQAKRAAQISEQVSRDSEKNTQLEIFLKFSEEYDSIKQSFHRLESYLSFKFGDGLSNENFIASLKTLKLFEREYFLWRKKMIQDSIWEEVLEPKVIKFLKLPATQFVWSKRHAYKDYDYSKNFEAYVEEKMKA